MISLDLKTSTAVILAAGNGTRLKPLTDNLPKCLVEVNGSPMLVKLIDSLQNYDFKRIIIVVGYLGSKIIETVKETQRWKNITIEFVFNEIYSSTNNVYSLWLARELINEPFLLLESDLVLDEYFLEEIMLPDRIAFVDYKPSMNGTTFQLDDSGIVSKMIVGKSLIELTKAKKTVNITSLSLSSWYKVREGLEQHINKGMVNDYYEFIFAKLIDEGILKLYGVSFELIKWYEIDTMDDFNNAEKLFSEKTIVTELISEIDPLTNETEMVI